MFNCSMISGKKVWCFDDITVISVLQICQYYNSTITWLWKEYFTDSRLFPSKLLSKMLSSSICIQISNFRCISSCLNSHFSKDHFHQIIFIELKIFEEFPKMDQYDSYDSNLKFETKICKLIKIFQISWILWPLVLSQFLISSLI